jgi:hypothetical protein
MELRNNTADIEKQFFTPLRGCRRNPPAMLLRDRLSHGGKVLIHEEYRYAKALAEISQRRGCATWKWELIRFLFCGMKPSVVIR